MSRGAVRVVALALLLAPAACAERVRVSRGTRMPEELRGASSAQVVEHFTRVERGDSLSLVATFVDFSYVRAVTRERSRSLAVERRAYERYVRRQTSFYVYLTLHRMESCRGRGGPSPDDEDDDEAPTDRLDLRSWEILLSSEGNRPREADEVEPGPTQLAPGGGCLVHGYVHFRGDVPRRSAWMELRVSEGEGRDVLASAVRWELEHWTPERRRGPRRERDGEPRRSRERDRDAEDEVEDETETAPEPEDEGVDEPAPGGAPEG